MVLVSETTGPDSITQEISSEVASGETMGSGWIVACRLEDLGHEDVLRFDIGEASFAIYRSGDNFYASDGFCTHGRARLSDGLVKGTLIECPKHNGRFDLSDGSPQRAPVCEALKMYEVRVDDGRVLLNIAS
jgi:MocE subfamily Rieske [2Fe-2S] domain protein